MPITSETVINSKVDWFAYTSLRPAWHKRHTMKGSHLERSIHGYTVGIQFQDGRIEATNPDHARMKTFVQYSGSALDAAWREQSVHPLSMMALIAPEMSVNRIDIAVDVHDGGLSIPELSAMAESGNIETSARMFYSTKTLSGDGETLYVGSPKSKVRLRIYDKAAEQHIHDNDWVRIELQIRGKRGNECRDTLIAPNGGYDAIGGIIRGFCDFPASRDYAMVLGMAKIAIDAPPRRDTNTEKWLIQTCLPSLARAVANDPSGEFLRKWERALEDEIQERVSGFDNHEFDAV